MIPTSVNRTILKSLPVNNRLKKRIVSYFAKLIKHNGDLYAADHMKTIRTWLLAYRADRDRLSKLDYYLSRIPFRQKGWLRGILKEVDSRPFDMLNLFKIYTRVDSEPLVTVEEASREEDLVLETAKTVDPSYGKALIREFVQLFNPKGLISPSGSAKLKKYDGRIRSYKGRTNHLPEHIRSLINAYRREFRSEVHKTIIERLSTSSFKSILAKNQKGEVFHWFKRWSERFAPYYTNDPKIRAECIQHSLAEMALQYFPHPSMYKDFDWRHRTSETYQKDFCIILLIASMVESEVVPTTESGYNRPTFISWLNKDSKVYINLLSVLAETMYPDHKLCDILCCDSLKHINAELSKSMDSIYLDTARICSFIRNNFFTSECQQLTVDEVLGLWPQIPNWREIAFRLGGEIQFIPKSGTVVRRPIAVPNRFLQMLMYPVQKALRNFVESLPRDCTYNQERFNTYIQNRIDSGGYIGSVDLSKATDFLPFDWFTPVHEVLSIPWDQDIRNSWKTFKTLARGWWLNCDHPSSWSKGQPLGTAPSFNILAITHNMILEALSATMGLLSSPYTVLGDDVLIFSRPLRDKYMRLMELSNVKLSLHKSYEGNLVEFAGKLFIKGQRPRYTPDHSRIRFENLFDYSWASGIPIRMDHLSGKVMDQIRESYNALMEAKVYNKDLTKYLYYDDNKIVDMATYLVPSPLKAVVHTPYGPDYKTRPYRLRKRYIPSFEDVLKACSSYAAMHRGMNSRGSVEYYKRVLPTLTLAQFSYIYTLLLAGDDNDRRTPLMNIQAHSEVMLTNETYPSASPYELFREGESYNADLFIDGVKRHGRPGFFSEGSLGIIHTLPGRKEPKVFYHGGRILKVRHERFGQSLSKIDRKDRVKEPQRWFESKYRPYTSDRLISCVFIAKRLRLSPTWEDRLSQ